MKTLPIVFADFTKTDKYNILLSERIRQERAKLGKILFISSPPERKLKLEDIIAEKNNIDFSEKIKQLNKEIFGI